MLDDPGRDERVGDLQQHRRATAEEGRQRRVADPADHALGRKVAVAARKALGVRALTLPGVARAIVGHTGRLPEVPDQHTARVLVRRATVGDVSVLGLDHVQLAAPPGCEEQARRFYGGLLLISGATGAATGGLVDFDVGRLSERSAKT